MENKNKGWFIALCVIGYLLAISYFFTLILIPLGIYCVIGANKYKDFAEMSEGEVTQHKTSITNWAIFFSIVGFPVGLISIVPVFTIGNNVTVTDVKGNEPKTFSAEAEQHTENRERVKNELSDLETLEKLKNLLDEGLITREEFDRAKSDLFKE